MWSYSKLKTYDTCPRRYKFGYIDRIPTEPNKYMQLGIDFHNFAEEFHKTLKNEDDITEDVILAMKPKKKYFDEFVDYELRRFNLLKKNDLEDIFLPKLTEHKMFGEINGCEIQGIVDRVDMLASRELCVIDYKPNNPFTKQQKTDLKRQLCIYMELIEQSLGWECQRVGAYYYKKQASCVKKFHPNTIRASKNFISNTVNKIEVDEDFLPSFRSHCNYCAFRKRCLGR